MMKKFISVISALAVLCLAVTAGGCGKQQPQTAGESSTEQSSTVAPETEATTEATTETTTETTTEPTTVTTTKRAETTTKKPVTTTKKAETTTKKPTTTAAPATVPVNVGTPSELEKELFKLINEERAKNGVAALKWSDQMYPAASVRGKECAQSFSHTRPDGRDCFSALTDYNLKAMSAAENLAMVYPPDAEEMVKGWMNSDGHRKNLLNPKYEYTAIGVTIVGEEMYAAQLFAAF